MNDTNQLQHQFLAALAYYTRAKQRIKPDGEEILHAEAHARSKAGEFLTAAGNDPKYASVAAKAYELLY